MQICLSACLSVCLSARLIFANTFQWPIHKLVTDDIRTSYWTLYGPFILKHTIPPGKFSDIIHPRHRTMVPYRKRTIDRKHAGVFVETPLDDAFHNISKQFVHKKSGAVSCTKHSSDCRYMLYDSLP